MAFPQIASTATTTDSSYNGTNLSCGMPSGIAANDLLLAFVNHGVPAQRNYTKPTGWSELSRIYGNGYESYVYAKKAVGSDTLTLTKAEGQSAAAVIVARVTGWNGDLSGADNTGNLTSVEGAWSAGFAAPDPPNLDPANWGSEDTLWVACGVGPDGAISTYPYAPNNVTALAAGVTNRVAICSTESTASSVNPGTFSIGNNAYGQAITVAVRPQVTQAVLTSPTVTNVTSTGATVGATTDTASGVFYTVATNSATTPTAAQIKLGQDHTGTSASSYGGAAGSVTVTTTSPSVALTGMTTGSTRRIYAVQTASGVDSAVLSYPDPVYPGTWRTASEVSATGWTVTGAASFAAAVNEDTASDAEFAQSPALSSTPTVRIDALDRSLPAGTYVTKIRLSLDTGSGFVRVSFLDGSNNVQGQSANQAFTATTTTFDVITTTTGASVRRRIELWV